MRLIESAASSLPSPMLASTLSEVIRKNILAMSINESMKAEPTQLLDR